MAEIFRNTLKIIDICIQVLFLGYVACQDKCGAFPQNLPPKTQTKPQLITFSEERFSWYNLNQ